ncbi:MAG: F0F1 ATP synthase subunit epsilon [Candidatus Competibacteraceae bacterium]|jgi:F-type H+-transporting ATPase subunit epsilon|nr:F0F1 ATP synthase subunit epsilon [Candidatus Competibacteraceae bacterium]
MHLKLVEPTAVLIEADVSKVIAEADNGFFCLLPRHVDFVAALTPGVFYYWTIAHQRRIAAIDEGILVKCGEQVLVSTLRGFISDDLDMLETYVQEQFQVLDEQARRARSAVARLEAGAVRRFMQLESLRGG